MNGAVAASASRTGTGTGAAWRQFICEVCGLIYKEADGDPDSGLAPGTRFENIPEDWACPICAVTKADFKPYDPVAALAAAKGQARSGTVAASGPRGQAGVLIVGAGRAGWQVAQALRELHATLPITVVSACEGDVYDKPQLSVAVARDLAVDRLVRESAAEAAARLNVRLLSDTHAVFADTATRRLRTTRGTLRWQHLVLAHGAEPALPAALPPQQVWRVNDLAGYRRLRAALDAAAERRPGEPQHIAIVGAGLVGCELANDLARAGHRITLLDAQDRPLSAQVPEAASARLLSAWKDLPIAFIGGVLIEGVDALTEGSSTTRRVRLQGREPLTVDHVIAATGLRSPGRLARSAGLHFDTRAGGISVSGSTGMASVPGVYALGDCAVVDGAASRYIEPIGRQARAIAHSILGLSDAVPPAAAPRPVLRVKTSSLPITVSGHAAGGVWRVERDDENGLLMHHVNAAGEALATLTA